MQKVARSSFIAALVITLFAGPANAELKSISKSGETLVWAGCGITKKAFMKELAKAYEKRTGVTVKLQGGGATKGIRGVSKGEINIGGSCRPSMEFNKEERYVKQYPVAWDAVVFITHKDNPVNDISIQQIKDIYNGVITNWSELGGSNAKIELYVRKSAISGVGQTLRELVFHDTDKEFTSSAMVVKSTGPAEKAVESNINAFTATGVSSAKKRNVKILSVGGKDPSYEHIKSGQYIFYRPLYLVTKLAEKNRLVKDFISFATSKEGKAVIRKAGTVPYTDALHLLSKHFHEYERAAAAGL